MSWADASVGLWLLHTALGGGLLLLIAWLAMRLTRQPARRQRLGEMGLAGALLIGVLSLAPAWLILRVPAASTAFAPGEAHASLLPAAAPSPEQPHHDALTFLPLPEELADAFAATEAATTPALPAPVETAADSAFRAFPWT